MRSTRLMTLSTAVALMLAALAACSSSGKTNGGGPQSATTSGVGAPIVIGSIASISGPLSATLGEVGNVLEAWAKTVNSSGGINGHQIKLIVKDDGASPATALAAAKDLVENQHVVAIVGAQSLPVAAWASYVSSHGIPVVGGLVTQSTWFTNPGFYPSGSSVVAAIYGALKLAKQSGVNKMAVFSCAESPDCANTGNIAKKLTVALGMEVVFSSEVSATAPDYSAACVGAKSNGANGVLIVDGANPLLRIADSCEAQGLKATELGQSATVTHSWLTHSAMEGAAITDLDMPFFVTSTPATKAYRDALTKYVPGYSGSSFDAPNGVYSWVAGKLFEVALKADRNGPITSASIKQGLYSLKDETLGGLAPPLNFTPGKPAVVDCYFEAGIKAGQFTLPGGTAPVCAPSSIIAPVVAEFVK
jgi:branched-chain amino acid transport system substrate-binding protein